MHRRRRGGRRWRLGPGLARWGGRLRRLAPSWGLVRWVLASLLLLLLVASAAIAVAAYLYWPPDLPSVKALEEYAPSLGTKVYADDDELLTEFQAERRIFVPLREIPKSLRDAVIAIEDSRFYTHFGVDLRGIARAAYANFRHNRIVEGGSTITQQLAKLLFLTPDRSFERKVKEALLALELEKRYSKDRLLEIYLNQIYLGHGSYGVEAAARMYFGTSVQELTLSQAALLAALPRAPGSYSPFDHPELARKRRARVLERMVELGYVAPAEARRANAAPLGLVAPERRRASGQYFLEYLQQSLEAKFGSDLLYKGGLSVYTALNPVMQRSAERALREGLQALATRQTPKVAGRGAASSAAPEGAVLVIEPQTGYIKVLVGGSDFARSEFNRAIHARRQPGSAFKPFVYLAAIEAGRTPADLIDDSPVTYTAGPGKTWAPENYDGKFRGPITLQQALEESVNVPTVRLAEQIGVGRVIEAARHLGIQSALQANLTLALGSSDVTLLELTAAYGALASQGVWMEPIAVRYVTDAQGRLIEENIPQGREAVNPAVAYVLTHMLRGAVERGTAVSARALGRPIAGKTGTTNDFANAWFVGYTPSLVAGVWVGHDRVRSLGPDETGARAALPIWISLMREILKDRPVEDFPLPDNVAMARIDMTTGFLANPTCPKPVVMAFVAGTEPTRFCPVHP
ncbi:MAG: PBP1A family penicillin-binding protein [Candidatus Rokubacteria bacterium]|nr:PBP1A family penicillin-binding protein [Candidatus Rokubacteria bacterium]